MMRIVNIKKYANKMTQTMYAHVNKWIKNMQTMVTEYIKIY
jgi:hypothetical protein